MIADSFSIRPRGLDERGRARTLSPPPRPQHILMSRNDDDDDDGVYQVQTIPPPSGGDAYSAPTKVGPMTTALVEEMMHAAKQKADLKKQSAQALAPIVRPRRPPPIDRNEPPTIPPSPTPPAPSLATAPAPPAPLAPRAVTTPTTPAISAAPLVAHVARPTPRGRLTVLRLAFVAAAVAIVACVLGLAMYIAVARGWHLR
jgi:hypothetical protein